MKKCKFLVPLAIAMLAMPNLSRGAVGVSSSPADPALGADDQYNLVDDLEIPGGTTPGGGTFNSQAYSDNAGPPGQIFTTPNSAAGYKLSSVSFKGTGDAGGGSLAGTWGIRVSSVSGSGLTPLAALTDTAGPGDGTPNSDWVTWSFSDADVLMLNPATQYAVEVFSSNGWWGIGGSMDSAYAGGTAFNNAGSSRSFTDDTLGDVGARGYDRTFHVGLVAVPEPTSCALALSSLIGLLNLRRSR